jgi:hypothetical protein
VDKLQWDIHQMCLRNRDGSFATRAARERTLDMCARQLNDMGYRQMRAQSLKPKHVEALANRWQAEGLAAGTLKNRMAHLRWWAGKVGRESVIPGDNARLGVPERSYVSGQGKQLALDVDKLVSIQDERVKLSLLLQDQFGLRREESIKFQPSYAIRGDELHLKASWTKGGLARAVPIRTAGQRWVLEQAKDVAGKGSLIPPERTYAQHLKVYEGGSCGRRGFRALTASGTATPSAGTRKSPAGNVPTPAGRSPRSFPPSRRSSTARPA